MKRNQRKRASIALCVALVLGASSALAETPPSIWDRAKDPAVGERYRLHLRVQELMNPPEAMPPRMRRNLLDGARAVLEEGSAATSSDMRLRFDLGEVYYRLDSYDEAIKVLAPALKMAPRASASVDAWEALAFAAAKLDRSQQELEAYDAYLSLTDGSRFTLNILSNRAEAEMRLGNLEGAVAGYRDVIERGQHTFAGDPRTLVLARYGLAVALDRSGDTAEAEHEALRAVEEDPGEAIIGDQEDVFFVPKYERDWYYALGRTQRAKQEPDAKKALEDWNLVVETWADYISRATLDDRWLGLAHARLAGAEAARTAAAARFPGDERTVELPSGATFTHRTHDAPFHRSPAAGAAAPKPTPRPPR